MTHAIDCHGGHRHATFSHASTAAGVIEYTLTRQSRRTFSCHHAATRLAAMSRHHARHLSLLRSRFTIMSLSVRLARQYADGQPQYAHITLHTCRASVRRHVCTVY